MNWVFTISPKTEQKRLTFNLHLNDISQLILVQYKQTRPLFAQYLLEPDHVDARRK